MELALWRWSTAVQVSSLAILTVFFGVLSRSVRLAELRFWVQAWACNLGALVVTILYWYLRPGELFFPFVRAAYGVPKAAFVLLLLQGGWALKKPGSRLLARRPTALALGAYAVLLALLPSSIDLLGVVQHIVMTLLFAVGGVLLARRPGEPGLGWLAAGFVVRSLLCALETGAYASQLLPDVAPSLKQPAGFFLSAHSSFDSGAEWLLALGCVLALSQRAQRELLRTNANLLSAQEELRRLVDVDPLTALANRRALPEVFRAVQPRGATLVFLDLDGFKQINDLHGHHVGDECLKRFAAALRESFRPGDAVVRYAGDEFLVVASGLDRAALDGRIASLRERLLFAGGGPRIRFSLGIAELTAGGHPEAALEAADEAMYRAKSGGGR